jgi:predicted transcriptional regulator
MAYHIMTERKERKERTTLKKMTFTLDQAAVRDLDRIAGRLDMAKSEVVREALRVYGQHIGRLTDAEREAMLATFDRVIPSLPDRPRERVEDELGEVRKARRGGGRRSPRA